MILILTTTATVAGKPAGDDLGIVTAEAILGANFVKDFFTGIRDIGGGRSGAYEKELRKAREIALADLEKEARHLGPMPLLASASTTRPWARSVRC